MNCRFIQPRLASLAAGISAIALAAHPAFAANDITRLIPGMIGQLGSSGDCNWSQLGSGILKCTTVNGYTPLNKAGDTMTGTLTAPALNSSGANAQVMVGDRTGSGAGYFYRSSGLNRLYDSTGGDIITYGPSGATVNGTLNATVGAGLLYTGPFTGTVAEALNAYLSRLVYIDDFGAAGDGVTDDSAKLVSAAYARQAAGSIVKLSCGKNYLIASNVMLGAPGVTVEGCWHHPTLFSNSVGFSDTRFLGYVNTVGHIVRAPGATISVGMAGGLKDVAILQQGLTFPLADASAYAGTAVACAPGGKGSGAHLDDVLVIGAALGFDCSSGATPAELRHVNIDATAGLIAGQSAGSSVYDDVDVSVFGTQDFTGYPVTNVSGNGATTTVTFTVPSGATTSQFPNGDLITLPNTLAGASGSQYALYPSVIGYKITGQSVSGTTATVQFASAVNTSNTPVTNNGNLTEYTRQYLRTGTGFQFGSTAAGTNQGCDDTHIGRVGNFGSAIGFDFQCNGIANADHLWADDNSVISVRIGRPANGNDPGKQVAQLHLGSVFASGIGGIGLQVNSPSLSNLSTVLIDKFSAINVLSDCVQSTGQVSIALLHVGGCTGYGVNLGAGSKLQVSEVDATVSTIGQAVFVPGVPAENLQVGHVTTDGPAGGSLYGGVQRQPTILASAATLLLPITAVDGAVETYAVSGSTKVTQINNCWGNRTVRFVVTGTATFGIGGNITTAGGNTLGGNAGSVLTLFCDAVSGSPTWRQMQ